MMNFGTLDLPNFLIFLLCIFRLLNLRMLKFTNFFNIRIPCYAFWQICCAPQCSNAKILKYQNLFISERRNLQTPHFLHVRALKFSNAEMFKPLRRRICKFSNVEILKCRDLRTLKFSNLQTTSKHSSCRVRTLLFS